MPASYHTKTLYLNRLAGSQVQRWHEGLTATASKVSKNKKLAAALAEVLPCAPVRSGAGVGTPVHVMGLVAPCSVPVCLMDRVPFSAIHRHNCL